MATKMTRRKFLLVAVALFAYGAGGICADYAERRNKKFKRTGKDRPKPGDGKGGDDHCCKEKK